MIKGVNKLIVEVANPNSDLFERAIFFVKPQKKDTSPNELAKNADALIFQVGEEKRTRLIPIGMLFVCVIIAAGLGAAITALLL